MSVVRVLMALSVLASLAPPGWAAEGPGPGAPPAEAPAAGPPELPADKASQQGQTRRDEEAAGTTPTPPAEPSYTPSEKIGAGAAVAFPADI